MYKIEAIGMRNKRNRKTIIAFIILLIIAILGGLAFYIHYKYNNDTSVIAEVADEEGNNTLNIDLSAIFEKENSQEETTTSKEITVTEEEFIDRIDNIYNGTEGKRVFLTFDDGPSEEVTPYILDILDEYNIKATFFVLGNRVKANPELVKREYESGHYIANHGYTHKYKKIYKSASSVLAEYNKTEEAIREAIGNPNYSSHLFRFPGGSKGGSYEKIKAKARKKLNENGIAYLDWSALTYDAEGAKTKKEILKNLKSTINGWDNVVVLMHDAADKQITYESLGDVIEYLQEEGYSFENIYDLMEE